MCIGRHDGERGEATVIRKGREGQSLIIVAFGMVTLLGVAGMAVDVGSWYVTSQHLQTAADAAALAGAQQLPTNPSQAVANAIQTASQNGATITANDVVISPSNPDIVTVHVPGVAPTYFTRVFGLNGVPEQAQASAEDTYSYALNYALFSQSQSVPISLGGSYYVDGNVHSNDASQPVTITGSGGTVTGQITGTPNITLPTTTWSQLMAENPDIITNGDSDGLTGDPDGNACNYTLKLNDSTPMPPSGTVVVLGNIDITGNVTFNGTLIAWGGNITAKGTAGFKSATFNALMALSNPAEVNSACDNNQGNVSISGNVTVTGAIWADNNASLDGNAAVAQGSVTGNTVSLQGDPQVIWNPAESGNISLKSPWLIP